MERDPICTWTSETFHLCFVDCFTRMSSLDKLHNSFHAAGTNGRLDLSLPRCASCCPTNCLHYIVGIMDSMIRQEKCRSKSEELSWLDACENRQVLRWCGTQATSDNAQSIIENAVNVTSRRTTTSNWCTVLSGRVDQRKSKDADCLGTCTTSRSCMSPQQCNSGGEFLAQSLEMVMETKRTIQLYPKIRWYWTGWQ